MYVNARSHIYKVFRKPVIVTHDSDWQLPKKKGIHVQIGLLNYPTGEAILLQLNKRQALVLAEALIRQVAR